LGFHVCAIDQGPVFFSPSSEGRAQHPPLLFGLLIREGLCHNGYFFPIPNCAATARSPLFFFLFFSLAREAGRGALDQSPPPPLLAVEIRRLPPFFFFYCPRTDGEYRRELFHIDFLLFFLSFLLLPITEITIPRAPSATFPFFLFLVKGKDHISGRPAGGCARAVLFFLLPPEHDARSCHSLFFPWRGQEGRREGKKEHACFPRFYRTMERVLSGICAGFSPPPPLRC